MTLEMVERVEHIQQRFYKLPSSLSTIGGKMSSYPICHCYFVSLCCMYLHLGGAC